MKIDILEAPVDKVPVIQNMARFYAYDLSKSCGFYSLFDWSFPEDGLYEALDLSNYWKPDHYPFLIRVDGELAGFVLIDKIGTTSDVDWNMGQFFIVGKYQGKGVGRQVAVQIFEKFSGTWEVMQMPDNIPAIAFWKKVIAGYTNNKYSEERKIIQEPQPHENIVLKFIVA
ncbi:MAG: GNAT family N-acetyltransferase [Gammaproteobacteria bacterium]|nr:GNAT family N-acetyltransferase [Gammaproteobacteria bacterium]